MPSVAAMLPILTVSKQFRGNRGLMVYEQDWLHNEWEGLKCTLQSATLAREWLLQMGKGAKDNGLFIQYCMAYSRWACWHGMSVEAQRIGP